LNVKVRRFQNRDEEACIRLLNKAYKDVSGNEPITRYDFEGYKKASIDLLVAEFDDKPAGFATVRWSWHPAEIGQLAILAPYVESEVGPALINEAVKRLESVGAKAIEVMAYSPRYHGLLERCGFTPVRKHLYSIWDLTKPLPTRPTNREVVVKPASSSDAPIFAELYVEAYKDYWGWAFGEDLGKIAKMASAVFRRLCATRRAQPSLAYLKDEPVGLVCPYIDDEWIRSHRIKRGRLIFGVGVLPQHRRKHIGTTLLLHGLRWLKEQGMKQAYVTTFTNLNRDTPAFKLYLGTAGKILRQHVAFQLKKK